METKIDWNEEVQKWDDLIQEYGGTCKTIANNKIDEFLDSLEERAKEEYSNIKKLFVDPTGDVRNKYSLKEKTLTKVLEPFSKSNGVKKKLEKIERNIVKKCVEQYLEEIKQKISNLKLKYENTERTYEKSLELITGLRLEYVNRLWFAGLFETERTNALTNLNKEKEKLNKSMDNNKFEEAQESQKKYLITEKKVRQLEQGRDNNSVIAVNTYNQLVSIYETYQKAKIFCSFLQKTTGTLEQTYNDLTTRWEEYQNTGNMTDVVESLRLTEVLKNAEQTFKKDFSVNFPLIKKAEEKVMDKIEAPKNMETQSDVYKTALDLKKNVMGLFP